MNNVLAGLMGALLVTVLMATAVGLCFALDALFGKIGVGVLSIGMLFISGALIGIELWGRK